MRPVVLLGSSRTPGHTHTAAAFLAEQLGCPLVNLSHYNIAYYDYEQRHENDQFIGLIEELLQFDHWILASPVYWYTMSAQLKTFLDRWSDLVTVRKDLGRKMAGKTLHVLCCGSDSHPPPHYTAPFEATADYMDMHFGRLIYVWIKNGGILQEEMKVTLTQEAVALGL